MIAVAAFENCDPSKIYLPLRAANPNALVCRGYESAYMGFTVAATPSQSTTTTFASTS